jgi:type 1 glutamine amidotransferase
MSKINLTVFVSPMGHDVTKVYNRFKEWMDETEAFNVTVAGTFPFASCTIEEYMLDAKAVANADAFIIMCSDEYWTDPEVRKALENAVANGTGILFTHGIHPCFSDWEAVERMVGLMWRDEATHGDFNYTIVHITSDHPITRSVKDFNTKDELFCGLSNRYGVDMEVLATAFSDYNLVSRHGAHGTGNNEPVLTIGSYGKARTVNFILGHVWTYYTGHGLLEDTLLALEPPQIKTMLLRSFEWVATGKVERTERF